MNKTLVAAEYPGAKGEWYYEPSDYLPYRFVLGTVGEKPLICVGINPSTAQPSALDNTLKSVDRIARNNGFDSWIMFNVYPQRATNPDDMDDMPNEMWHLQNMAWLKTVLQEKPGAKMWAAWGTLVDKRPYLRVYMREMVRICQECNIEWVTFGKRSKVGHPHHPLYLPQFSTPDAFDVTDYLNTIPAPKIPRKRKSL